MPTNVGISYGVLSPSIAQQLRKQKFKFNPDKVKTFQKQLDAVNLLRFHENLLTDSMVDKILPKLHKAIVKHVAKENNRGVIKPQKQ